MRPIHLANSKKRDAEVAFENNIQGRKVRTVLEGGEEKTNVKILKTTVVKDFQEISMQYKDLIEMAYAIIESDPEVDMETTGKKLLHTRKLYVTQDNEIAYRLNLYQVIVNPDGTEKERRDINKIPGNVNNDIPLKWTGKMIPVAEVLRKYVFSRNYQLRHINGATFDFLYNMAQDLHKAKSMVLIGAGPKGTDPILLSRGGTPYRGFLEGRVDGESYCLILHLTDIELKGLGK